MDETVQSESNFKLWLLIGRLSHSIDLVRQRELSQYHVPIRQLHILRIIQTLGSDATLSAVAKKVEREFHVISRQTIIMEKDGLIKRIKNTPKSQLLKLELTEKGLDLINITQKSKSIDDTFSFLSQEERHMLESILTRTLINMKQSIPD